jgi:hypothetical protein
LPSQLTSALSNCTNLTKKLSNVSMNVAFDNTLLNQPLTGKNFNSESPDSGHKDMSIESFSESIESAGSSNCTNKEKEKRSNYDTLTSGTFFKYFFFVLIVFCE